MKGIWKSLIFAGLLSGCTAAPFVDARREAGQREMVGTSTPDRVAVCYNALTTTPETVRKIARRECARTGRVPVFAFQEPFSCRLFLPARAYFHCVRENPESSGSSSPAASSPSAYEPRAGEMEFPRLQP